MNMKDCRGEFQTAMRFREVVDAKIVAEHLKLGTEMKGIPAVVTMDTIHSGGLLFGKDYPCVKVSHPNPPQQYFDLLFIINDNVVSFQCWGNSKANYDYNKKEQLEREGKHIRAALVSVDPMALQSEQAWQRDIMDVFDMGRQE